MHKQSHELCSTERKGDRAREGGTKGRKEGEIKTGREGEREGEIESESERERERSHCMLYI